MRGGSDPSLCLSSNTHGTSLSIQSHLVAPSWNTFHHHVISASAAKSMTQSPLTPHPPDPKPTGSFLCCFDKHARCRRQRHMDVLGSVWWFPAGLLLHLARKNLCTVLLLPTPSISSWTNGFWRCGSTLQTQLDHCAGSRRQSRIEVLGSRLLL